MVRILIADDHGIVRKGLLSLLEDEPDFKVVGEAVDGADAITKVNELKPDILITDMKMPGKDGLEVTCEIRESSPGTRVLVLSMYGNKNLVSRTLAAGASGYILKKYSNGNIIDAVRKILSGELYLSPGIQN